MARLQVAAFALAAALAGGCARAEPPVWVVSDKDSELVLFGSVHVLPPDVDWASPVLERTLKQADDLWFELPVDPAVAEESSRTALRLGLLPQGQSLSKLLKPEDAQRMARVAQAYDVDPAMLEAFQPWLAEMALAGAAFRRAKATDENGVEEAVSAAAPASAQRRAFETAAEQIGFFVGAPMAEQVAALNQTVREMEGEPDEFALLVEAWASGDLEAIDRQALTPLRRVAPTLFRRLVTERNARWAATLDQRLKGRGRTVVVVGVGHLIGPEGLPERLRALGYSVKGP
ncbi:TraB/GumN family protein [Phenylobacterium sp.]|uniref:TraB/GumN family protein n=1 Tax=Phenylobacterium sp. TaxID=1871053 RepID=UPI002CD1AB9C|nr:TraB/GumN family protein [Phenylobacterium sp.]HVI31707.1 TraB/GumN family protein [Phenylobacterium sp.]